MRACISISKKVSLFFVVLVLSVPQAWAAAPTAPTGTDKTMQPEDEDFSTTPFTEYGTFNEEEDEEAEAKFFQYGRFFGVSLGVGTEFVSGNRGLIWQGGFPVVDFKLHYWFDFNFALDLGFFTASHFFESTATNGGHVDINVIRLGVDLKYYFDTKNLAAPISFANPYLLGGVGTFSKTQTSATRGTIETESGMGLSAGAGLEFAVNPRKVYFEIEGKIHIVTYKDTSSGAFDPPAPDLTGHFYTFTGNLLFTW